MCGIAGFIDGSISKKDGEELLSNMLISINHRGPDNTGTWTENDTYLGHNRLSIIDLSSDGNQPMHYDDLVLTFNGEIYNYLEIREQLIAEGHTIHTKTDSEIILASYRAWGESCVDKFVGMWAFVIWDRKEEKLFCSRDRFGIKPFYYIMKDDKFYFASEVKALKTTPYFSNELNEKQISIYLQLGWYFNHDETLYKDVKILPAAHNITINKDTLTTAKYWEIDFTKKSNLSFEEKVKKFKKKFYDSINLHIRSDVEVGSCLSGGLDSSSIVGAYCTKYSDKKIKAFNIYYEGKDSVDERPWISFLQKKHEHIDLKTHSPLNEELQGEFDKFMHHMEFPPNGSSPFSQYFVMKTAGNEGLKVLLNGQGSDEYLAGYMHGMYRFFSDYLSKLNFKGLFSQFSKHRNTQGFTMIDSVKVFSKSFLSLLLSEQALYNLEYKNYFPFLSSKQHKNLFVINDAGKTKLDMFLNHQIFQTSLPNLLHNEDSNSMAFSIESRVPFLDHRLVQFAFELNNEDKVKNGLTKRVLRNALSDELPDQIVKRTDKKGFVTPGEVKWLKGPLKFLLDDINVDKLHFLNKRKVKTVINEYKKGNLKNANLVWRIGVLNYWFNKNDLIA